jgi:hypothetical protein
LKVRSNGEYWRLCHRLRLSKVQAETESSMSNLQSINPFILKVQATGKLEVRCYAVSLPRVFLSLLKGAENLMLETFHREEG